MSGNINFRLTKGQVSSSGAQPLSGTYYVAGGNEQNPDQILAPGTNQAYAVNFGPAGSSAGNLQAIEIYSNQNVTITTNGVGSADVQTVSITGTPTGGTFPLVYSGQVAAGIPYNASAATVQSALQALSNIGAGNITCTGGPLPATPIVCTFAGTMNTGLKSLMLTGSGGLTGGTSPAVSVAHTTPGLPQDTIQVTAGIPILWDINSISACPFAGAVSTFYVTNGTTARVQARILTL